MYLGKARYAELCSRNKRLPLFGIHDGLDEPDGGVVNVAKEPHDAEDVESLGISSIFSRVSAFH